MKALIACVLLMACCASAQRPEAKKEAVKRPELSEVEQLRLEILVLRAEKLAPSIQALNQQRIDLSQAIANNHPGYYLYFDDQNRVGVFPIPSGMRLDPVSARLVQAHPLEQPPVPAVKK